MQLRNLLPYFTSLLLASIASAQVRFVNPQNFGGNNSLLRSVAVSTGGAGSTTKDIVGFGRDGLKYFTSRRNGQQLDRYVDDSRRAFPNPLLPQSALIGITEIDAGDINGDGYDDLILQSGDLSVTPMLSALQVAMFDPTTNGYPQAVVLDSFQAQVPAPGSGLAATVLADINNDGLIDILESRYTSTTTIEFAGIVQLSPGVFAPPSVIAVITAPPPGYAFNEVLGLDVGDLDGDLDQDFAVSVVSGGQLSSVMELYVLTQGPGGTYLTTHVQTVAGDRSPDVVIADVNGDGVKDLAYLNLGTSGVQIFSLLNLGGSWSSQALWPFLQVSFGSEALLKLQTADWQSDGLDDLLLSGIKSGGAQNSQLRFYTQSVAGTFVDETSQRLSNVNVSKLTDPSGALVSDFNSDGRFDILVNSSSSPVLLMGSSNGLRDQTFTHGVEYRGQSSNLIFYTGGRCVGDLNNDQFVDLVTIESGRKVILHLGNGTGNFRQTATISSSSGLRDRCVTLDVDLDGDTDIFVPGSPQNQIFLNTGNGTFVPSAVSGMSVSYNTFMESADVNGDNRPDIIILGGDSGSATQGRILLNFPAGFTELALPAVATDRFTSIEFGDFDGDTDVDLAVLNAPTAGGAQPELLVFWNGGGLIPTFSRAQILQGVTAIGAADINRDSRTDLIATTSPGAGSITANILYNLGTGSFGTSQTAVQAVGAIQDMATGDFNGDGFSDVVLSVQPSLSMKSGTLALLTNNQAGGFVESEPGVDINYAKRPIVVDVDNDGDLDIFYNTRSDQSGLSVLLNHDIQFLASVNTSVVSPTPITLELDTETPGTFGLLLASLDPLSSATATPFGFLRLTNFMYGPIVFIPSGVTFYYPINLGSAPTFVGQTLNVQMVFFDFAGNISFSNPQSVLLTN